MNCSIPHVMVGGLRTAVLTRKQLAERMVADCLEARRSGPAHLPTLVFSSNGQGIALAGHDKDYADIMAAADIVHADGQSVVFASRLTASPLPERICTTDFFDDAAKAASAHRLTFFLLGASEEQNECAERGIRRQYPDVKIVGRHHGYFADDEDEAICQLVRTSKADVLWVGLGKPRQEYWCVRNRERLAGIGWVKTCGGLYSYFAGDAPRAPRWVRRAGLEWFYRLLDDPKRLAWRYATTNPYALFMLLKYTDRTRRTERKTRTRESSNGGMVYDTNVRGTVLHSRGADLQPSPQDLTDVTLDSSSDVREL